MFETGKTVLAKTSETQIGELSRIDSMQAIRPDLPSSNRRIWKRPQVLPYHVSGWRRCLNFPIRIDTSVHFRVEIKIRIVTCNVAGIGKKRKLVGIPDLDSGVDFTDFLQRQVLPYSGPVLV